MAERRGNKSSTSDVTVKSSYSQTGKIYIYAL